MSRSRPVVLVAEAAAVGPEPIEVRSFDDFYTEHYRAVVRTALALTRDLGAAEDLAQDAFVAARRGWDRIGNYERPEMWVRRAVTNRAISRLRRLGRETRALMRLDSRPDRDDGPPDPDPELWDAVRSLPTRQAQVVVLAVIEDLPVADIAELLGCGYETVRTHLRRGRARLAELIESEEP